MAILTVGPSGQYATIAAAVAASGDGDIVQVQAGTYVNDFVHVTTAITIEGVGGPVQLVATVPPPDGKAIMTIDTDATIKGLDFSGAQVADGNGAGIRYEGGNLTVEDCSFHDNQDGLLSSAIPDGNLTITGSTFTHNGTGDGLTHNLYVGDIATLTVTDSTFTDAVAGHEIKSRAQTTVIQGCTVADGPDGTASYSIDLPDGGNALIQGNTIEKGPGAENQTIIHYGGEGIAYAGSQLAISGNTVTNDLVALPAILLTNSTPIMATISGNTFLGTPIATYAVGPATLTGNQTATGPVPDTSSDELGASGDTIYITDAADHTVVLPSSGMGIEGGAGHLTATGFSHETVVGGAGGVTWNGQDGADQIITASDSSNVLNLGNAGSQVQSQGTDVLTLGAGNNSIAVGGTATLSGGTGNNGIAVNGAATISGAGVDNITVGANASANITESNVVYVNSNGGTFSLLHKSADETVADQITVAGGAASLVALDTSLNVTMAGGSNGAQITLGTGSTTLLSTAPDTIHAGAGLDTVILGGSAQVYGGTAALSVFGRGIAGLATVHGGTGAVTLDGDTGNILFLADSGKSSTVNDRLSHTTVAGGAGVLTVNAMAGALSVQGGSGGIVLNDGAGGQTVTTAAGSRNQLNLVGGATVVSNGTDTVNLVSAGNSCVTTNGSAVVLGGTGNNVYVLNGIATLTSRSTGVDRTTVGGSGIAHVMSSSSLDEVQVQGGWLNYGTTGASAAPAAVTVSGWAGIERANGSAAVVATQAGHATCVTANTAVKVYAYGSDTVYGGAGAVSVSAAAGGTVHFGAGGGDLEAYGNATVSAGAGAVTVDGWSGSLGFAGGAGTAQVNMGPGNATVTAGSGNMTLTGGSGTLRLAGGSGATVFNAGSGGDTVTAGAGAMTVNAGAGQDVLALFAGQAHGPVLVNNFDTAHDSLLLIGYGSGAAQASTGSGGTLLTLADGTTVQFAGVSHLPGYS